MKRLVSLDLFRGWAIIVVVILHGIIFTAFTDPGGVEHSIPWPIYIILIPIFVVSTWASVFALMSGVGTAYSVYKSLVENDNYSLKKRYIKSLIRFTILIFFHFIWAYFFSHPDQNTINKTNEGLITGSLRKRTLYIPPVGVIFTTSAFTMLAFAELFIGTALYLLFRNGGHLNYRRNEIVLLVLGFAIILSADPLYSLFKPVMMEDFNSGNLKQALILTWLFDGKRAAFPDSGFAFFGAWIGLMIAAGKSQKSIIKKGGILGWMLFFIGFFSMVIFGFPVKDSTQNTYPFGFYTMNLGIQLAIAAWAVTSIDFMPIDKRRLTRRVLQTGYNARRWGIISLTLYMFEQPFSAFIALIFRGLFGDKMDNPLFVIIVFAPFYIWLCFKLVKKWESNYFKYSLEWAIARIAVPASYLEENPDILHINERVYFPAFKEKDFDSNKVSILSEQHANNCECSFLTGDHYYRVSLFRPWRLSEVE